MTIHRDMSAIALLFCLSLFSSAQAVVEAASGSSGTASVRMGIDKKPVAPSEDYVIGVDDVLAITVWKEPDISKTIPVRPDGKITLPLVGDVQAAGKTPRMLQQELHNSLASFVAVPEVAVIVQEVKSVKFNIVGEVARPGSYPLGESMTVLDAIAQAGGVGIYAKSNSIYVLRLRPDGSSVQLPFHYKQVLKGTNLSQNVRLQPRDTIVVP
jgi:polysaccharide export outer membrane protein